MLRLQTPIPVNIIHGQGSPAQGRWLKLEAKYTFSHFHWLKQHTAQARKDRLKLRGRSLWPFPVQKMMIKK